MCYTFALDFRLSNMFSTKQLIYIWCIFFCFYTLALANKESRSMLNCVFNSSFKISNVLSKLMLSCFRNLTNCMEKEINVTSYINDNKAAISSKTNIIQHTTGVDKISQQSPYLKNCIFEKTAFVKSHFFEGLHSYVKTVN